MASGDLIRKARELVGETQAQFAARFGVVQSTIAEWEANGAPKRGPARIVLEREIAKIQQAFGEVGS